MSNRNEINSNTYNDVYMTRHSARADRDNLKWKPLPGHARDDTELSVNGEQATRELAQRFQDLPVAHIVSSPFYRCLQTMEPIALAKGISIKVEPGICEVLSTFPPGFWDTPRLLETNIPIDTSYEPIVPRNKLTREFSDGQAAERAQRAATAIRETLDGPILFCGHGASCLGIGQAFGTGGYVGYSSFSHFRLHEKDGHCSWKTVEFGDVSHLSKKLRRQSLDSAW